MLPNQKQKPHEFKILVFSVYYKFRFINFIFTVRKQSSKDHYRQ